MATTTGTKGEVKFWDVETGVERATFTAENSWIHGLSWSPRGAHLAIISTQYLADGKSISSNSVGNIRLLFVANKPTETVVLERKTWETEGIGSDVAFSPDGNYVADARHAARVWRAVIGKEVAIIRQMSSTSSDRIRFSPDGKILALGGHQAITLWDVAELAASK